MIRKHMLTTVPALALAAFVFGVLAFTEGGAARRVQQIDVSVRTKLAGLSESMDGCPAPTGAEARPKAKPVKAAPKTAAESAKAKAAAGEETVTDAGGSKQPAATKTSGKATTKPAAKKTAAKETAAPKAAAAEGQSAAAGKAAAKKFPNERPARDPGDTDPHMTGLVPASPEEEARERKRNPVIKKIRLNKIGLARINAARKKKGLAPLTAEQAQPVPVGKELEVVRGGAPETGTKDKARAPGTAAPQAAPALPDYVDNSTLKYFPPIRSQGSLPSCGVFNGTYYVMTHMLALARDYDAKNGGDSLRMSPRFTYALVNGGAKVGSWYYWAYAIGQKHGCVTWEQLPYSSEYRKWPQTAAHYREAIGRKFLNYGYIAKADEAAGMTDIKSLLNNGYILNYATYISSWQYKSVVDDPGTTEDDAFVGNAVAYWMNGTSGYHGMTLVGYNDNIWCDINGNGTVDSGEKGAYRIANSWGTGWRNGGYCWVAYDALKATSEVAGGPSAGRVKIFQDYKTYWCTATTSYTPKVVASFTLRHLKRRQIRATLGLSATSKTTPESTWYPKYLLYAAGGDYAFDGTTAACDTTFYMDFTDLVPAPGESKRWYLGTYDSTAGDVTDIKDFKLYKVTAGGDQLVGTSIQTPTTSDAETKYVWIDYTYTDDDNTPPTISDIANQATDEDAAEGPIAFTVGDAETSVGDLTLTKSSSNAVLVPTANIVFGGSGSDRTVTITPAADQSGTATITVTVTDGGGLTAADSFTLTVNAVNDAPVADAQSVTTPEDTAKAIKLTADDVEGDALSWHIVSVPAHGVLTGTAPNLTYTPAADYNGADSFTFKVNDGSVDSNVATVSITVTAVNDAPTADAQSVTTAEDTAKAITLTGSDPEGDALTCHVMAGPAHGTLSGTGANRTYTPDPSYSGADSFTFKVNDGTVDSTLATVSITVTAVNDAPVADAQSVTTPEDIAKAVTLTANDPEGDALSWHIVAAPAHGTLSGTAPNLTYTPAADYHGADSFTFKVNDGSVDSNVATISITVTAVNDLPTADAQSATTPEDVAKAITLTGSDPEGSALTYIIVAAPAHGTLTGTGASRSYTPDLDYNGADSFTFKVNDGADDSNVATVSITVTAVNDAPVISTAQPGTPFTMAAGSTQVFEVWPHDPDADTLSYSWKIDGAGTADADSDLSYSPVDADAGDHVITVTVSDGKGGTDSHTWNLKVTCLSPVIALSPAGLTASCVEGASPANGSFEVWNSGGGTLTYSISDNAAWLSCTPGSGTSTGEKDVITVSYSAAALAPGVYNATISISAGGASNSPQTIGVALTVSAKPAISRSPTSLTASCLEGASPVDDSFEVWNSGGGTLTYSISDNAAWLSCTPNSGTSTGEKDVITVKYSTAALAAGVYNATISISAGGASNSPQTVSVTLTVNALPPPQPAIATSITSLSNTCKKKSDAAAQSFMLWNSGGGTLSYSISDDAAWLSCSPVAGTSTGEKDTVAVSYSTSSLVVGTYTATITITAPGASNTPQTVPVTLIVTPGTSSKSAKDSKTSDAEGPGDGGSGGCSMSPAAGADPVTWALPYLAMLATCLFGRLRRSKKSAK
jgi:C1A family cysteine protease